MIDEEKYNKVIDAARYALQDASDMINADIIPYADYFTSTGKWDSRKSGFVITFIISNSYLSTKKFTSILADTFTRINTWMDDFDEQLVFLEHKMGSFSGENRRIELKIVFDDIADSAKKLLLR